MQKITKAKDEWKQELPKDVYHIAFEEGTDRAFSHPLHLNKETGIYKCRVCGLDLFSSDTKYESGSGWPSFFRPIAADRVETKTDLKLGVPRTEVHCNRCHAHLGHVFNDGPKAETGLRYCLNGTVLDFDEK